MLFPFGTSFSTKWAQVFLFQTRRPHGVQNLVMPSYQKAEKPSSEAYDHQGSDWNCKCKLTNIIIAFNVRQDRTYVESTMTLMR